MNKMISWTGEIVLLAVLVGVFCLLKQLGCPLNACCMITVTLATAIIAYQNKQQNKVGIEASQRQAEAATEQTKAIQQQIEISKQQANAAKQQADIARKELEEAQKQREEAYRPRLVVYFEKKNDFTLQLVIENVGNAPAYDIDVSVKAPWEPYQTDGETTLVWNTLEPKCTYLTAKGKTVMRYNGWSNFYNCTPIQLFLMQVKPLEATLQYSGGTREKPFTETHELYLSDGIIADTTDQTVSPPFQPPAEPSPYACREYIKAFLKLFEHGPDFNFLIPKHIENVTRDLVYTYSCIEEIRKSSRCAQSDKIQKIFDQFNDFIKKIKEQIEKFNEDMKSFYNISPAEELGFVCYKAYPLELLLPHLCNKVYFVLKEQIDKHPDKSLSISKQEYVNVATYKPEEIKKLLEEVDQVRKTNGKLWEKINTIFKILGDKQIVRDETCKHLDIPDKKDLLDKAEHLCKSVEEFLNEKSSDKKLKLDLWISKPSLIPKERIFKSKDIYGKSCISEDKFYTLFHIYIVCKELRHILEHLYNLNSLNHHLKNIEHILNFGKKIHIDKKAYLEQALMELAIKLSNEIPVAIFIDPTQHWFYPPATKGFECDKRQSAVEVNKAVNSMQLFNPEYEISCMNINFSLFLDTSPILQTFFEKHKELDLEHYEAFLTTPSADT